VWCTLEVCVNGGQGLSTLTFRSRITSNFLRNLFPASKKISLHHTKIIWLMMFKEIIITYSEDNSKPIKQVAAIHHGLTLVTERTRSSRAL
jgi:hypothetical protein